MKEVVFDKFVVVEYVFVYLGVVKKEGVWVVGDDFVDEIEVY